LDWAAMSDSKDSGACDAGALRRLLLLPTIVIGLRCDQWYEVGCQDKEEGFELARVELT
jgi:hypothetical protein